MRSTCSARRRLKRPGPVGLIGLLVGALFALTTGLPAAPFVAGTWTVDVTVTPDKPTAMLGEPNWLSFTVTNLTEENLQVMVGGDYRNGLGRPNSFKVETKGPDGALVAQPVVGMEGGGLFGPQKLPAKGSYVFRLFLPHWATFAAPGAYVISCARKLELVRATTGRDWDREPKSTVEVQARTALTIEPRDEERMGHLIAAFAEIFLRDDGSTAVDEASAALLAIDDPRVVPPFRRGLATRLYSKKFTALRGLAKYDSEEAFAGLQAGMETKASDFDHATPAVAPQLAINIRHAAAVGLSEGRHPKAHAYLLARRHDEAEAVRITVLHLVGKMPPEAALPILREMTRDESVRVADEARRYLALQLQRQGDAGVQPPK